MNNDEAINNIVRLGLSLLQAKIYVAVLNAGSTPISVKAISCSAKVVRQDTYRALSVLQKKGLVEKILDNPNKYRCATKKGGLTRLLNQKTEEYNQVRNKTELMLKHFEETDEMQEDEHNDLHFSLTQDTDLFIEKFRKEILRAKSEIDIIYQKERISILVFYLIEDFKKAINRGIKIKIITNPSTIKNLNKNLISLQELDVLEESLEIKYSNEPPKVGLVIVDASSCFIRIGPSVGESLFTTNSNVIALARLYFTDVWNKSYVALQATLTSTN